MISLIPLATEETTQRYFRGALLLCFFFVKTKIDSMNSKIKKKKELMLSLETENVHTLSLSDYFPFRFSLSIQLFLWKDRKG